jgi:predicted nucleic acid-binding protein
MKIEITPVVVVPDVAPLIHLAAAGQLALLQEFGRVVVMDVVVYEASGNVAKPWAQEVAAWLAKRQEAGSSQPFEIVKTEIGEAYRLARLADPEFKMRNAGENAIRDWLVETVQDIGGPALVIYEDKLPNLIRREHLEEVVVMATTRAFLMFAEERGLIKSAENVWNHMIKRAASASPSLEVKVMRPTRAY